MFDLMFHNLLSQVPVVPTEPVADPQMSLLHQVVQPDMIAVLIPIIAIVTLGAVWITKMVITHRERMAMLEIGINPNQRPSDVSARHAETVVEQSR